LSGGIILGWLPLIIFEVRNNFYNSKTIIQWLITSRGSNLIFQEYYYLWIVPVLMVGVAWWLDYGSTERWCVFDAKVGSQATRAASLTYEIDPGPFDSIALLNIEAESITVTVEDIGGAGGTITWNETTLADGLFTSDVVKTNFLSTFANPHVTVLISYAAGTAKIGEIVIGLKESLGSTQYNPAISIIDYSIKEVDTFGNYSVLERAYSKRLTCQTTILNTDLDETYNTLANYRARPVVWVGSEDYASMIVYGFYKDFSIEISYPTVSICSLEVEGLV
jgi:hypothetical protein